MRNPHKDDGHEFCDVLAVFEDHVFIFFDREKQLAEFSEEEDPQVRWSRWKRGAIDRQINTAHGAERYIRSGRRLFLDAKKTKEFPIPVNTETIIVHRIIVAHGAVEACKSFSESNVYGSLAICYGEQGDYELPPFVISLDRNDPVHVFDSHNLPIILGELDTVKDFSDYLDSKTSAIKKLKTLYYCGEEDLLANYWLNLDSDQKTHYVGVKDPSISSLMVAEGEWRNLIALPQYIETKRVNKISYLWDKIIDKTCANWSKGDLLGDGDLLNGRNTIHEMAKEPRFTRRIFAERMCNAIDAFPATKDRPTRYLTFLNSFYPDKGYVFLQLWVPLDIRGEEGSFREKRQEILMIACGSAKNYHPHLKTVIGIAIPPPKLEHKIGEDLVWMDCSEWSEERSIEYKALNEGWNFFATGKSR